MIIKEKVIELREKGLSFRAIATLFGVSGARIHQICSGYKSKNDYRKRILKRDLFTCQWGQKCNQEMEKGEKLIIHHIDGNDKNNDPQNLITLCKKCHFAFHNIEKNNGYKEYHCKVCGIRFDALGGGNKNILLCERCYFLEKNRFWCKSKKLYFCKKCGTNKRKHKMYGLCMKCYNRKRYKKDKEFRKRILKNSYKFKYGDAWEEMLKKRVPRYSP